ncbi:cupin domain-containing protein [Bacteroidota bacterium]|nr:cupin domain-containing protein [Bacteroidota bacterium]|tara:strand:- start:1748 stop:2146 length:399 start_codon:yes stop_codon:yes gene_type:complete
MKVIIYLIILLTTCNSIAQEVVTNIQSIKPAKEYKNIHVQKISSDSLSSTFVIWIKKKVRLHKHLYHRENVIIQEGSGQFQLKDSIYNVSAGDIITIPKNTWHGVTINSKDVMKVISVQSPKFLGDDRVFKN